VIKEVKKTKGIKSPVQKVARSQVPGNTRILLFVRAGGRCEFDGCNKYLLHHSLTFTKGIFAQTAHIVAFKPEGPRGRDPFRPTDIDNIDNLMLLCSECHKLIDDHPAYYTRKTLRRYKQNHEDRIYHITGLGPDQKTTIVQLKANIAGQSVDIPVAQVTEAVAPRYPNDLRGFIIDITGIKVEDHTFIHAATQTIKHETERLYAPGMDVERTRHISLFALAPIPLLVYLGRQLSNKIQVDLFQRHRDTGNWTWKATGDSVNYSFDLVQSGQDFSKVALLLSLSGKIHFDDLGSIIDKRFYIYEISLKDIIPNPTFLNRREDLLSFKKIYQISLRKIIEKHGKIEKLHFLPAVPAPIAVLCGHELFPKVDPTLIVYDYNKADGGFAAALEVN
jgi:hypothetical protein